uniref:Uncharacterized protein n=1 Tax=Lepeophtheirus salmonis TaxID=72036 RepID=A0A0K2TV82_LEPSM
MWYQINKHMLLYKFLQILKSCFTLPQKLLKAAHSRLEIFSSWVIFQPNLFQITFTMKLFCYSQPDYSFRRDG